MKERKYIWFVNKSLIYTNVPCVCERSRIEWRLRAFFRYIARLCVWKCKNWKKSNKFFFTETVNCVPTLVYIYIYHTYNTQKNRMRIPDDNTENENLFGVRKRSRCAHTQYRHQCHTVLCTFTTDTLHSHSLPLYSCIKQMCADGTNWIAFWARLRLNRFFMSNIASVCVCVCMGASNR